MQSSVLIAFNQSSFALCPLRQHNGVLVKVSLMFRKQHLSRGPSKGAVSAQEVRVAQIKLSRIALVARPEGNSHTDVLFFWWRCQNLSLLSINKRSLDGPCCLSQCTLVVQEKMPGFAWRLEGGGIWVSREPLIGCWSWDTGTRLAILFHDKPLVKIRDELGRAEEHRCTKQGNKARSDSGTFQTHLYF